MAKLHRSTAPLNFVQLQEYRTLISKMTDRELARQYRWLHERVSLKDGVPTPDARAVQEFVQAWREAHRRGRITPLPNVR